MVTAHVFSFSLQSSAYLPEVIAMYHIRTCLSCKDGPAAQALWPLGGPATGPFSWRGASNGKTERHFADDLPPPFT